jgi:uncharacterized membrane protein
MSSRTLLLSAAVGAAGNGGVFFAFSAFVMPALARLHTSQGIAAMQSINITAVRPPLMVLMFGTAVLMFAFGVHAATGLETKASRLVLVGALVYLVGVVGTTIAFNVPKNDELAAIDPNAISSIDVWRSYLGAWTVANHVRTVAGFASAVMIIAAERS